MRRSTMVAGGILGLLALVLSRVPLFNVLGYEFSAVIGFALGIVLPPLVVGAQRRSSESVGCLFLTCATQSWLLLMMPLALILANALLVKNCDPLEGLAFYGLIPGVTSVYVVCVSVFWATALPRRTLLASYAHLLLSVLFAVHNLIFHPPVFTYHSLIGFFPGPIYDERVAITLMLVLARLITLLFAGTLLWAAYLIRQMRAQGGLWIPSLSHLWYRARQIPLASWLLMLALLLTVANVWWHQATWGFRPTRGSIQRALGGRHETEHFILYYDHHSRLSYEIERLARDHEFRYAQLASFLEVEVPHKIRSYIYASADQKKRFMGARHTSVEDPVSHSMHIHWQGWPHPVLKHELAHVLAATFHPLFRMSLKMGLHEGIAMAAEWDQGALTPHQWAKAMRDLRLAPPIAHIMNTWGFWTESSWRSYTLAGSFVRFLVDRYGMDAFKRVFPTGNFSRAYDKPLNTLVAEWETFLESVPLSDRDRLLAEYRFRRPSIFAKPCAHEIAERSDLAWSDYSRGEYLSAIEQFEQICAWDPQNPRHLRGLLYANYRQGDLARAESVAEQIMAHENVSQRLAGIARKVLGDIRWEEGHLGDAASRYEAVHAQHLSAADDREMVIKRHALNSSQARAFRDFLLDEPQRPQWMQMQRHLGAELGLWEAFDESGDPVLAYLIGRRLFSVGADKRGLNYLRVFVESRLPFVTASGRITHQDEPSVIRESHRMMGIACYRLGRYDGAVEHFRAWERHGAPLGEAEQAQDWMERCRWMQGNRDNWKGAFRSQPIS